MGNGIACLRDVWAGALGFDRGESRLNLKLWRERVWREFRANNVTRGERDVLLTLSHWGAEAWPSHQTLAERARCSIRTVQRALTAGAELGLVQWFARRVRRGWRSLRTSNIYRLTIAIGKVVAGAIVRPAAHSRTKGLTISDSRITEDSSKAHERIARLLGREQWYWN